MGPGGRISTVDCSRVLNVNGSLYSSTSRGRVQRDVLRALRARLYAAPTCTTGEAPVYVYCLYSSFTTVRLQGGLPRLPSFCLCVCLSVCSVGNLKILKTIKKHYKSHAPHGGWFTVVFKNMLQDSRILGF